MTRVLDGADVLAKPGAAVADAYAAALRCMTPADDLRIGVWLAKLQAGCARRPGTETSAAVQLGLYTGELSNYPADVARAACEQLVRGQRGAGVVWFPTLGEVIDTCEALVAERRAIVEALGGKGHAPTPEALPAPTMRGMPTEAERDAVKAMRERYIAEDDARIAETARPPRSGVQGAVDRGGITPELRALMAGRAS